MLLVDLHTGLVLWDAGPPYAQKGLVDAKIASRTGHTHRIACPLNESNNQAKTV